MPLWPFLAFTLASLFLTPWAQGGTPVDVIVSSGGGTITAYSGVHRADAGSGSVSTGGFQVQLTAIEGLAISLASHATFCTELGEHISFTTYTNVYDIVPLQYASMGTAGRAGTPSSSIPVGGIGLQAAAELRYFFDHYYVSEDLSDWTVQQSQAFQLAVWEIGHDPGNFNITGAAAGGGSFYVASQGNAARNSAIAAAQAMLDAVRGANVETSYASTSVDVWSLADANGVNATTGYQDILFATFKTSEDGKKVIPRLPPPATTTAVPEPSTFFLVVVAAFGGMVGFRRRRSA